MMGSLIRRRLLRTALFGLALSAGVVFTGCQIETGGQSLPSPYYMQDDVQYFPPGPEFKLAREAAVAKTYREQQSQPATRP